MCRGNLTRVVCDCCQGLVAWSRRGAISLVGFRNQSTTNLCLPAELKLAPRGPSARSVPLAATCFCFHRLPIDYKKDGRSDQFCMHWDWELHPYSIRKMERHKYHWSRLSDGRSPHKEPLISSDSASLYTSSALDHKFYLCHPAVVLVDC
jgi:hypothetical protein